MQKGTIVEKLVEELAKDSQHLRHLIDVCEGNPQLKWLNVGYNLVFTVMI